MRGKKKKIVAGEFDQINTVYTGPKKQNELVKVWTWSFFQDVDGS